MSSTKLLWPHPREHSRQHRAWFASKHEMSAPAGSKGAGISSSGMFRVLHIGYHRSWVPTQVRDHPGITAYKSEALLIAGNATVVFNGHLPLG